MDSNDKKLAEVGMEAITDAFLHEIPRDQPSKAGRKLISYAFQLEIPKQPWYKNPLVTSIFDDRTKKILYYIDERTGKKYNNPENIPRLCWMN